VSVMLMAVVMVAVCMCRSMGVSMAGIVRVRVVVRMGMRVGSVIQDANIRQSSDGAIAEGTRPGGGSEEEGSCGGQKTAQCQTSLLVGTKVGRSSKEDQARSNSHGEG